MPLRRSWICLLWGRSQGWTSSAEPFHEIAVDRIYGDRTDAVECWSLERVAVGFAGSDPQSMIDRSHEYLAVADLPGARAGGDDFDRLVGDIRRNGDFDPQLRQKIHHIFCAAIDLRMALLAAVTLDLGHGHTVDADLGQRLADF